MGIRTGLEYRERLRDGRRFYENLSPSSNAYWVNRFQASDLLSTTKSAAMSSELD
jgi:hypothetical protein